MTGPLALAIWLVGTFAVYRWAKAYFIEHPLPEGYGFFVGLALPLGAVGAASVIVEVARSLGAIDVGYVIGTVLFLVVLPVYFALLTSPERS